MDIQHIVVNFFTFTQPQYVAVLLIKIGLIVGLFLLLKKYRPRWKYLAYFVLLILMVRVLLFDQHVSWGFYNDHLTVDDVGWRHQSEIPIEYYKFFRSTRKIKFLAVGSSQTYVVYTPYSKAHRNLNIFNLAGMSPLDFYLYRKYIAAKNPEYILLYLSEFDLAKEPRLDASKSAPHQGLEYLRIFPILFEISRLTHSEIALKEMVAGEFFPEYKYSFIFKGFSEKFMRKNNAMHVKTLYEGLSPNTEQLKNSIESLAEEMDEHWIKYNKYFLNKFISYCRSKSLKVIIVEGQYNPLAYTEKSLRLNQMTHRELEGLENEFDNVVFWPRSKVLPFNAEDYMDSVHVKPEPATRFVESLMKNFEMTGIK